MKIKFIQKKGIVIYSIKEVYNVKEKWIE